ncbi:MAG: hypothetical protein R3B46_02075 [Phycisphaerales bacterium]|nr:hypothetical protein [Phycisphaerales bacterium]
MSKRRRKGDSRARDWAKARRVLAEHKSRLLRRKGVVGVDIGIKRSEGQLIDGPSIRVHVAKKIDEADLHPNQRLPESIEGVPVDVIESPLIASACPRGSFQHRNTAEPLVAGVSIGRFGERTFGTLGATALDADGVPGGLTCAHVARTADEIRQRHQIGRVIGDVTIEQDDDTVDAAFIMYRDDCDWRAEVLNYGPTEPTPIDIAPEDLPFAVELVGACSGKTTGLVTSLSFTGNVETPSGPKTVTEQLYIEAHNCLVFARTGDSGGGVLAGGHYAGLLIAAGSPQSGGSGLATPMRRVLSRLGVTLADD